MTPEEVEAAFRAALEVATQTRADAYDLAHTGGSPGLTLAVVSIGQQIDAACRFLLAAFAEKPPAELGAPDA